MISMISDLIDFLPDIVRAKNMLDWAIWIPSLFR